MMASMCTEKFCFTRQHRSISRRTGHSATPQEKRAPRGVEMVVLRVLYRQGIRFLAERQTKMTAAARLLLQNTQWLEKRICNTLYRTIFRSQ